MFHEASFLGGQIIIYLLDEVTVLVNACHVMLYRLATALIAWGYQIGPSTHKIEMHFYSVLA